MAHNSPSMYVYNLLHCHTIVQISHNVTVNTYTCTNVLTVITTNQVGYVTFIAQVARDLWL